MREEIFRICGVIIVFFFMINSDKNSEYSNDVREIHWAVRRTGMYFYRVRNPSCYRRSQWPVFFFHQIFHFCRISLGNIVVSVEDNNVTEKCLPKMENYMKKVGRCNCFVEGGVHIPWRTAEFTTNIIASQKYEIILRRPNRNTKINFTYGM